VLTVASLVLFVVMSDAGRVSASMASEGKSFVLVDGDRIVTGFSAVGKEVTLWEEGKPVNVSSVWVLSFNASSFEAVETVDVFGRPVPAVVVEDVVWSEDVPTALAAASAGLGLPRGTVLEVSTARSALFGVLVSELFKSEDTFDLIRSGKVVIVPESVTFKFVRSVPDILVPVVKPFIGTGLESDDVAG
jgi:hypothetical protein